ncbi:PBP1A family penicillin-binding protein [Burkholderia sp. 567]
MENFFILLNLWKSRGISLLYAGKLIRRIFSVKKRPEMDAGVERELVSVEESASNSRRSSLRVRGRALVWLICAVFYIVITAALVIGYVAIVTMPKLPSIAILSDFHPIVPLRIYTADNDLIAQYGIERRIPLDYEEIPEIVKKAVLATEDARFYEHHGVDFRGLVRATLANIIHGGKGQGASTITMQLARNFFLSREKSYLRKISEILLAMRIETRLSKQQILTLYVNQIFLGERAYGFGAAARMYFGKNLADLSVAQVALLAGLPKAPSGFNPIENPARARGRQLYILGRMHQLGYLNDDQYRAALAEPTYTRPAQRNELAFAEDVGEMVRKAMYARYGEAAYERGFQVWTTIRSADQRKAYAAVRKGVADFEHRHRYEGPEADVSEEIAGLDSMEQRNALLNALKRRPSIAGLSAAAVVSANERTVVVLTLSGELLSLGGPSLSFARSRTPSRSVVAAGLHPGAIVRLRADEGGIWTIDQLPSIQGALVALTPQDGAIRALVGGNGYGSFNHVTQAWRQPGSTFKPFIYSAALDKGYAPSTIVDDAPFERIDANHRVWRPREVGKLLGPIALREALTKSKNLASVRVLDAIGPDYAKAFSVERFGFGSDKIVANLPMALGAGSVTPLQMASAYAVFANGGYRVEPYLIVRITDACGGLIFTAHPLVVGRTAPRMLSEPNSFIMTRLLQSVAQHGTAAATNVLRRADIAGKTGTTNDFRDGWFAGYQHELVAVAWMGFDAPRTLGAGEWGARTALPIWLDYMRGALEGVPIHEDALPSGVSLIDGELFESDHVPGHGFIPKIGVSASRDAFGRGNDDVLGDGADPPTAGSPVPIVGEGEKQHILQYFETP